MSVICHYLLQVYPGGYPKVETVEPYKESTKIKPNTLVYINHITKVKKTTPTSLPLKSSLPIEDEEPAGKLVTYNYKNVCNRVWSEGSPIVYEYEDYTQLVREYAAHILRAGYFKGAPYEELIKLTTQMIVKATRVTANVGYHENSSKEANFASIEVEGPIADYGLVASLFVNMVVAIFTNPAALVVLITTHVVHSDLHQQLIRMFSTPVNYKSLNKGGPLKKAIDSWCSEVFDGEREKGESSYTDPGPYIPPEDIKVEPDPKPIKLVDEDRVTDINRRDYGEFPTGGEAGEVELEYHRDEAVTGDSIRIPEKYTYSLTYYSESLAEAKDGSMGKAPWNVWIARKIQGFNPFPKIEMFEAAKSITLTLVNNKDAVSTVNAFLGKQLIVLSSLKKFIPSDKLKDLYALAEIWVNGFSVIFVYSYTWYND